MYSSDGEAARRYVTHAWIEVGAYLVDITASQFPEVTDDVIVETRSMWHRQFAEIHRCSACVELCDLEAAHQLIHKRITNGAGTPLL